MEKQYQDQILAQQEQYQCQIQVSGYYLMGYLLDLLLVAALFLTTVVLFQLIQDEIKAMVQLQNRQANNQPHTEFSPNLAIRSSTSGKDSFSPLFPTDSTGLKDNACEQDMASPAHAVFSSHAFPLQGSEPANQTEERATTGLSSGYGTLFVREMSMDIAVSPREDEGGNQGREKQNWLCDEQQDKDTTVEGSRRDCSDERTVRVEEPNPLDYQQGTSG